MQKFLIKIKKKKKICNFLEILSRISVQFVIFVIFLFKKSKFLN